MRLSSLKLVGFKSFAESSTLHFKDNRTAIVGPNGCGKSNVIDAIRWVMGESSAKQLRGGNMQDVIFAGTTNRKPVGIASVELRFENTYGELGGEYNAYTELSVKRQVTRDGKSDYFLNGTKCRRKDITDIFLGTGLGPRSYAVIEQGMINRLVDAKPEEMRVFIEEAAGISRYQARRKETVQHLEHTQSNLSRLKDIALELQSQIRTLKRQAEQAEKYQSLQQEIVSYKVQLFSQQYAQIFRQVDTLTKQLTALTEDYQTQHKALEQIEIEGHLLQQQIQKQLPQAEKLQQAWQKAQQSYQQILWRLEQNQTQQDQINQSIDSLQQQQQQFQDEFVQIQQELEQILSQYQHTEKLLRELEQVRQDSQTDVIALQTRFEQQSQEFQTEQQYLTQLQQQQKQLQYQLEQIQKTNGRTEQSLQQLQAQRQQFNNEESIFLLEELNIEIANNQIKFDEQMTVQQKLKCVLDEKNQQKNELYQKVQEIELIEKSLQREIQQTEKLLMNMKQDEDIEVKHALINQLQLTYQGQQYSALIEKILAKWLMAETSTEMDWVYQGARQLKLSERSERIHTIDLPSMETWINLPNHSLWQSIYIAQNIDEAKTFITMLLPQDSIVTEDGFWLGQDWLINLNLDDQDVAQGQLHYHIHLKELKQQQQLKCSELEPLMHQLNTLNGELLLDKEQLNLIQQQIKVLESNKSQLLTEQTKLQTSIDHNIKNAEQIVLHIEQLKSQWSDDVQEQEQLQFDLVSLQLKIEDIQPKVDAKAEQFEKNKARLTEVKQQATEDQQQLQQLQLQLQQLQSKQALLQRDEQFKAEKIEFVTEQLLDTRQKLQRLKQDVQLAQNNEQDARLKAEYEHQQWNSWQQQVESLQTQQNQHNEQRLIHQQSESELRDQLEQTRLQWQQKKTDQQHILEQLQQLGQLKPIEHSEINITFIQSKLEKAEQQFAKLGAINLAAFEELQQLQVRYDELNHQIQDLEQTIEQLHTAMKSIDQETKHLFMKTFDQVNKELQDLFPKVFSGGEASLSLDGDWQSGVRLMARPPGKRNSTLALLSGGEKALTALALVFGIFRLNPAPFCVLDEVDAPLDDANVGRFCNLVTELSQQVQFIYITHNKVAMTMATDLLGVTMPEAGSSKLVAVSLAQAEAYGMTAE